MNLLFDLDGTLTDPSPGITGCITAALRDAGVEPPPRDRLEAWIGPPLLESFHDLLGSEAAAVDALDRYRSCYADGGMFQCRVHDGIRECLDALVPRYRLFVATSKPLAFATQIVAHFGLSRYFQAVYGSELDGTRADKRDLIRHALERELLIEAETIMIGDRRHDIEGGRGNRIRSVGVLWGFGARAELEAAGADALCERPADLASLLASVRRP